MREDRDGNDHVASPIEDDAATTTTKNDHVNPLYRQQPQDDIPLPPTTVPNNDIHVYNYSPCTPILVHMTVMASLGGVLFGYDLGVVAGALPLLATDLALTIRQQQNIVSVLYVGGVVGAAGGGALCDAYGRRTMILCTDVLFAGGAFILYVAHSVSALLWGRFWVGVAVAVSGVADVSYLHEVAPLPVRGTMVSVNEACISLGFLVAYGLGYALEDIQQEEAWRSMFGASGILAALQFVGMVHLPESPVWLRSKGRTEQARTAMERIHGDNMQHLSVTSASSTSGSYEAVSGNINVSSPSFNNSAGFADGHSPTTASSLDDAPIIMTGATGHCLGRVRQLLASCTTARQVLHRYTRQAWIAAFLSVTQQFCGQTIVLSYAPAILAHVVATQQNGADHDADADAAVSSLYTTLPIGMVKFVVTALVIWQVERVGRRVLLLTGMTVIALGMMCLTAAFGSSSAPYLDKDANGDEQVQEDRHYNFSQLALPGVLLVVCGYSMSFGPLTWLLTSELFPTHFRGRALGASTIVTYACAALVTATFLSAQELLGPAAVFAGYLAITVGGIWFAHRAIPDTGGQTVDQIERRLGRMPWWQRDGAAATTIGRRRGSGDASPLVLERAAAAELA